MKFLILRYSIYLGLLLFFISCKSGVEINNPSANKNSIDVASFKAIPLTPGNSISSVKVLDKKSDWKYDLTIPKIQEGEKVPLFILLHGGVGSKNHTKFSNCLVAPGLKNMNSIIFSPSGAWRNWTMDYLEKRVLDFVDLAKKHWPIDPNKVVLIGYSNGAIAGWKYAKDHATVFSAMILMASNCKVNEKIDIPIYAIQGTEDTFFPIKKARKRISEAKKLGCNITFIEAQGKTHLKACEYQDILKTSIPWLENEVWKIK